MATPITDKEKRLAVRVVVAAVFFFGLVWGGENYVAQYTATESSLNSQLRTEENEFRTRLAQIQDEEALQNQYVESYKNYQEQGLILGEEYSEGSDLAAEEDEIRRLALLERLQEIQTNRKLFSVVSKMSSPQNLPSSFSEYTQDSEVAVRTNIMNISFPMLHSLDILMLLNDFYDEETNRFVPVRCNMTRLAPPSDDPEAILTATEKIQGECDLVWLTVYDPEQGKVTGSASGAGNTAN